MNTFGTAEVNRLHAHAAASGVKLFSARSLETETAEDYVSDGIKSRADALANLPSRARWFPQGDAAIRQRSGSRDHFGTFSTAEEAVATCRKIVGDWLVSHNKPGMTAKDLHDLYVMFGEDLFVLPTDRATAVDQANWDFGAWDYAKERANLLCTS
jgi:hypothetical protein